MDALGGSERVVMERGTLPLNFFTDSGVYYSYPWV